MIRAIIKFVLRITTLFLYRVKVVGKENIEDDKPYIICPNHISNWDPPTMVASLKRNDVYVLAKEEMFVNNFIKWLAVKVHALPVKRGKQDIALLKNTVKVLKDNNIVLMFPEGTRNGIAKNRKNTKWGSFNEFNVRSSNCACWNTSKIHTIFKGKNKYRKTNVLFRI